MRRHPAKVQIEFDHPVPNFATQRVEDFFSAWHPNYLSLKDFATSLYLQGLSDGFAVGEDFTTQQLRRKYANGKPIATE